MLAVSAIGRLDRGMRKKIEIFSRFFLRVMKFAIYLHTENRSLIGFR